MTASAAIRDRITALVVGLIPQSDTRARFRAFRNEGDGNLPDWSEKNATACLRRFQARGQHDEDAPAVSNTLVYQTGVTFEIRIAYPHSQRYGDDGALDRDDVMDQDAGQIEQAIGIHGRANFSGAHDCTPMGGDGGPFATFERGDKVDFLVITARFLYYRTVGA